MNENETKLRGVIECRCGCKRCTARTFLMLSRSGDTATGADCPTCGNWHTVYPHRLATSDEIPAAAGVSS